MLEFPKQQRLLRRPEFSRTMDAGCKVVTPQLVLIGRSNGTSVSRIGFIVSKKVGNSVIRNLVKRRLREIFRNYLLKPQGLDIVVIARGQAVDAEFETLTRFFHEGLQKLQVRLQRKTIEGVIIVSSNAKQSHA